ncbi:MAG: CDP-diacylglycerol--glycerol-3-phosphate 3-phosphatidyltransferase [Clostridia bacterium]|nr:CDP-diacylglycerol--glycerol-3-phosphate 3-phosphatidyltransferase [Clostridia bacterium]
MNIPNTLSLIRICLVPLVVLFYLLNLTLLAVIIFIVAACTDFLDGYIARKYNMVTDLGKLLDPIADKILVLSALFLISYSAVLQPSWIGAVYGTIIISRELIISVFRQIAASKGIIMKANLYGKIKTFVQTVALPIVLLLNAQTDITAISPVLYNVLYMAGHITLIIAVLLTIMSGVVYLIQNIQVLKQSEV